MAASTCPSWPQTSCAPRSRTPPDSSSSAPAANRPCSRTRRRARSCASHPRPPHRKKFSSPASPARASAQRLPSPNAPTSCTTMQSSSARLRFFTMRTLPPAINQEQPAAANFFSTSRPLPTDPRSPSFYSAAARAAFPSTRWSSSPPIPASSACWMPRLAPPRSNPSFAAPRQSSAKSLSRSSSPPSPRA